MAIVSRQEFADLCGDEVKFLTVYIHRGKVIQFDLDKKTLDTKHPVNAAYIKERKLKNSQKKQDQILINSIPPAPNHQYHDDDSDDDLPAPIDHKLLKSIISGSSDSKGTDGPAEWLRKKMKGDADLVALRVEKEQLLLDKAAGRLVPIDVAADVLRSQAKTIFSNMENALENIATVFCNIMANGDMDMYTRVVEAGRRELNVSINRAGIEANDSLDKIITNYTESRSNKL